jgi:DNA (cytosine-5)-methyltransferase 1
MTEAPNKPIAVDLFCGAGGMSLGFEQAGFEVVAAVDSDPIHVETHRLNFPDCNTIQADLSKLSGDTLRSKAGLDEDLQIDVVFGGPPCGGFSVMGKRDPEDPRNNLVEHFARLINELEPLYFVVENVVGLTTETMNGHLADFENRLNSKYSLVSPRKVLDASEFGVPQRRRRVFILGYKADLVQPSYPKSLSQSDPKYKSPKVVDAIADLANINDDPKLLKSDVYQYELPPAPSQYARIMRGEEKDPDDRSESRSRTEGLTGCARINHSEAVTDRFANTQPGEREPISKFHRLDNQGLAPTLRAGTGKSRGSYSAPRPIHPTQPRCITVREGARLHSFPDWFQFHHTKWHGFRQVGNSVPPRLARAVAKEVQKAWVKSLNETEENRNDRKRRPNY